MKSLIDIQPGTTVTVRKITGGRAIEKNLEHFGIMPGSDLTVVEMLASGEGVLVEMCRGQLTISAEDAVFIKVGEHFVRKNDPILLGGCCASGNTSAILERMEQLYKEKDEK